MARTRGEGAGNKQFFLISALIVAADQAVKYFVSYFQHSLPAYFLSGAAGITHVKNTGIAFGMLQGNNLLLSLLSAAVVLLIARFRDKFATTAEKIAAALILGGTVGNLLDRIFRGAVLDYLYIKGFTAFNIADVALSAGAFLIIAPYIVQKLRK